MTTLRYLRHIFNRQQKIEALGIVILMIIGTVLELVGITAVLPFIEITMEQSAIESNAVIHALYRYIGFRSSSEFLLFFLIVLIAIYFLKNAFLIYMNHRIFRYNYGNQRKLAYKMLDTYLQAPYTFFLQHNSAELIRNVKDDTNGLFDAMVALMQLLAELMVSLVLFAFLLYKDKTITLVVGGIMVFFVFLVMKRIKGKIEKYGRNTRESRAGMNKWFLQTFGGIKETLVLGKTDFFRRRVDDEYARFVVNQQKYQTLAYLPKPLLETVCVSALLMSIAVKIAIGVSPDYFISTIAVFGVAAFRLLPAFNRITGYMNRISFGKPCIEAVYNNLNELKSIGEDKRTYSDDNIVFEDKILVDNVSFSYPNTDVKVLDSLKMIIPKNKSIALIGTSGAGKTTIVDIILGLLSPQEGDILADGKSIRDNMEKWRAEIGYIPQNIYLLDDTILKNIAYGVEENLIDMERINRAVSEAQISQYIDSLEDGLNTVIGERGVRLSGGQRQRIGIARALYHDPDILILDEATSALDNDTESAVMEAIESLSGKKTLIIIAHRLTTIKNCDYIYEMSDGRVRETIYEYD